MADENKDVVSGKKEESPVSDDSKNTSGPVPPMPPGLGFKSTQASGAPASPSSPAKPASQGKAGAVASRPIPDHAKSYAKGPMFISIERFNVVKDDIQVLKNTLEELSATIERFKENRSVSSQLLKETTDKIEVIEVKVASINSVVRT